MGQSISGIIPTTNKDVWVVASVVEKKLQELSKESYKKYLGKEEETNIFGRFKATYVNIEINPSAQFLVYYFQFYTETNLESRKLMVHFNCNYDVKDLTDSAIIVSLGLCGSAELLIKEITKVIQEALNEPKAYIKEDNKDYESLYD